ncbi:MAG: hypothetical protein IJK23_09945 [Clostridia bacterium]|nr:hypothetical protein [Clostridia bacterium]
MSDISLMSRTEVGAGINVFLTDDVGGLTIDRARKLLTGIPHGAEKAIGSALKRATTTAEAYAARVIGREYVIKAGDFKSYTQSKKHYITSGGSTTVDIEFRGHHIPLYKFDTKVGSDGRVTARVKKGSSRKALDHAFGGRVGMRNHAGVFERETSKRLPIREFMGPSTPQMMSFNDDIQQEIGDKLREAFDARIDHEILAVLNGWRG